ncbi:sialate O-acetylesterase [Elizabethkingia anophelis]|nr:sialate O-acetylesterase [Elizabethkingia anophelis]
MKKFFITVLTSLLLFSCATDRYDENDALVNNNVSKSASLKAISGSKQTEYDIFLIAGQSNTYFGLGYDPNIDTPDPDIFQVGRNEFENNKIITATEPLHHYWLVKPSDRIGFGLTFAKNYKKNLLKPGRKVLLVPCGYAGSSILLWGKGTLLYNDAVERTLKALKDNPGSEIKGILWHQGEADALLPATYTPILDKFITDIRNDLGNSNLPIVLGGMVPYWVNLDILGLRRMQQENIKNTPRRLPRAAYADPNIPFVISKPNNWFDDIHYDANGQRELGARYFNQYKTLHTN